MVQEEFLKENFLAELETAGEEEVRRRITTRRYASTNNKRGLAQQWLDTKAKQRADELIRIAKEAKDAAEQAARNTKSANTMAAVALLMAAIALTVVILSPAIIALPWQR